MRCPKFLGSSQNPEELSLTIKGILLGLIPVVLIFAPALKAEWLNSVIEAGFALVSAGMIFYGVIRKFQK